MSVSIQNYKSIKSVRFDARRVNVFIGEPNSGKSNLLEALSLLGKEVFTDLKNLLRSPQTVDLFFDHDLEAEIDIKFDGTSCKLHLDKRQNYFIFDQASPKGRAQILSNAGGGFPSTLPSLESPFRYYKYAPGHSAKGSSEYGFLTPPYGRNLPDLLYSDKTLRQSVAALFRSKGFRLEIRPQESEILISKEIDDVLYSYPFESISETLRRIVFYKAVLETNQNAVLLLDEPEANTFPFYTKYLAERISLDETNQFFLTTHNPYVLMSIIEKTPRQDLAVFITRMQDYRTELRQLEGEELDEMLELSMDVFLNLDRYFPE